MFQQFRKLVLLLWLAVIVAAIWFYFSSPELFAPNRIAEYLRAYQTAAFYIYAFVSVVRGFTLLPSTPLVIAGTLAFPDHPWMVLVISMFGIVASSSMIYWFSGLLGIAEHFETRKPKAVARIRTRLEHPTGLLFVFLWAFFPLVPTDAVCYVAGSIRMSFPKFIAAIATGELVLCSFYVFGGGQVVRYMNL